MIILYPRLLIIMYHVTCGPSKKIIKADNISDVACKIESQFNISMRGKLLQYFDDEIFKEWTDVEDNVPNKCKLRVVSKESKLYFLCRIKMSYHTTLERYFNISFFLSRLFNNWLLKGDLS